MSAIGMGTTQGKTFLSGVSRYCFVLNGSGVTFGDYACSLTLFSIQSSTLLE